jgi:tetrahydromethanopterin S-methyltransferase subunit E
MIDWDTILAFMGVDTIVHFIVGLIFLPIGARFIEYFARKKYGHFLDKKPNGASVEEVLK